MPGASVVRLSPRHPFTGPTLAKVLLMGHSQGATVVLNALASPNLTASARARVIAAAVFGDPNYATNQPINAPGAQNASSGIFGPRSFNQRLTLNSMRFWGWPQGGSGQDWV